MTDVYQQAADALNITRPEAKRWLLPIMYGRPASALKRTPTPKGRNVFTSAREEVDYRIDQLKEAIEAHDLTSADQIRAALLLIVKTIQDVADGANMRG